MQRLDEEAEVGLKLGLEASVGYNPPNTTGGVTGGVKFTAEATAKYNRKWGHTDNVQDTIDIELPVNGPFIGLIQALRGKSTIQVSCETTPHFEGQIKVYDGNTLLYSWNSYADLLRVLNGQRARSTRRPRQGVHLRPDCRPPAAVSATSNCIRSRRGFCRKSSGSISSTMFRA